MAVNDLIVRIIGDSRSVERAFAKSSKAADQFGRSVDTTGAKADKGLKQFKGFATGAAAGFGGAFVFNEVAAQMKVAIDVASNLQEQISATRVVFEDSAPDIIKWGETTSTSIGIANDQALAAATIFGSMFDAAGRSSEDAADLSKKVVTLGADLASFKNTSVDEALTALRAGLSGEIEPLRRYQVFLTEAAVGQQAMADTGKTNVKQLTQGEKIMARYKLIMQSTTKAQGDITRTAGGFANQQKFLAAQTRDLQADLGGLLLPTMTQIVGVLNEATTNALILADALKALAKVKIPVIEIPFTSVEVPGTGGTAGGLAGGIFKNILKFTGPQAAFFGAFEVGKQVAKIFDDAMVTQTPQLANEFARSINTMTENALDTAAGKVKPPSGAKGFGKGLTPQDLFGPLVKDIPLALQEALLDAQISGSDTATRAALVKTLSTMTAALDDPRLKAPGRIAIKKIIDSIKGQIKAIDSAAASAADTAKSDKASKAEKAATKRSKAWANVIDALQIQVSNAEISLSVKDDLEKLLNLKKGLQRQIKAGVDVVDAQEQLAQVENDIVSKRRERVQEKQFRALGLSITGEEIVPGIKNLQTRIAGVLRQVASGQLVLPQKLVDRLKLARKLIKSEGKKLSDETRSTINDFIKAATGDASDIKGPLTKTTGLNADKILTGLGLTPQAERELRDRLSKFNSAGRRLAGSRTTSTGRMAGGFSTTPITVNTYLDGQLVASNTTRHQQKTSRRTPNQKRGGRRPY